MFASELAAPVASTDRQSPPAPDGRGHTSGFPGTQREAQTLMPITGSGSAQASVAERPVALPPAIGKGARDAK